MSQVCLTLKALGLGAAGVIRQPVCSDLVPTEAQFFRASEIITYFAIDLTRLQVLRGAELEVAQNGHSAGGLATP